MTEIKEAIAILEKEQYLENGVWKHSPGVLRAIALLKEQPPAGELTKRIRLNNMEGKVLFRGNWPQLHFKEMMKTDVLEACDRLDRSAAGERILEERIEKLSDRFDRSEASRKELKTRNANQIKKIEAMEIEYIEVKDLLQAAIAKAKKEGGE